MSTGVYEGTVELLRLEMERGRDSFDGSRANITVADNLSLRGNQTKSPLNFELTPPPPHTHTHTHSDPKPPVRAPRDGSTRGPDRPPTVGGSPDIVPLWTRNSRQFQRHAHITLILHVAQFLQW